MFVFLTLALPRLFYFAEYEILTATGLTPDWWMPPPNSFLTPGVHQVQL